MTLLQGFSCRDIDTQRGHQLRTHVRGPEGAPVIVAINALGMDAAFWQALAEHLTPEYRFLTLNTRLLPGHPADANDLECDFAAHVQDVKAVFSHYRLERVAAVLGWCTGAQVALGFAAAHAKRVSSLLLCCGSFQLESGSPCSSFRRGLAEFMPRVLADPSFAEYSIKFMRAQVAGNYGPHHGGNSGLRLRQRFPHLWELAIAPFQDVETLLRYARLTVEFDKGATIDWNRIQNPALIVGAENDQIAHPELSRLVHERLTGSELHIERAADHYLICEADRIAPRIRGFLERVARAHV